jgi:hypothetical protein
MVRGREKEELLCREAIDQPGFFGASKRIRFIFTEGPEKF